MNNLSESHRLAWTKELLGASFKLLKITIEHFEQTLASLNFEERRARHNMLLSTSQATELEVFQSCKIEQIWTKKLKKFSRDNIIVDANIDPTKEIQPGSHIHPSNENLKTVTEHLTTLDQTPEEPHLPEIMINLSNSQLTSDEKSLLSRGLKFCPSNRKYNEFQLFKDLDNFSRNLRLREYFFDKPNSSNPHFPRPQEPWTPKPGREKYLDMYIKAVQGDILQAFGTRRSGPPNLTRKERNALGSLGKRTDIVIKPADKGGGIVILDKDDYIQEGNRQLNNPKFYKKLSSNPTAEHRSIIGKTLTKLTDEGELPLRVSKALTPKNASAGRFYMLPKIHKENYPGRPIVSGIGTLTEPISDYIDSLIKHIPPKHPSYIRDTNHFLRELSNITFPHGAFLVTLDVVSLYTNIPHDDGIQAMIGAYEKYKILDSPSPSTIETLANLVLKLNTFEFNNSYYLQTSGTAMGTKMAPNYANIFMSKIESDFLSSCAIKPIFYKRFLDDIFMIWTETEDELVKFIASFNNIHPSISFTHTYSTSKINFLDVLVRVEGGALITSVYKKPTDRQQYLHFKSCHPRHCKTSIPYSQAIRFKRICSKSIDFQENANRMRVTLEKQHYPPSIIEDAIKKAEISNRHHTLAESQPTPQHCNLILTFADNIPNINKILKKHFNIIEQSQRLSKIFSTAPQVTYRRPKNLQNHVVHSTVNKPRPLGCTSCGKSRCQICKHMQSTALAKSTHSNFKHFIREDLNCDSSNVVYMLECGDCGMQYIGQTDNSFRLRFNNHRSHAQTLPNLPLSKHLRKEGHEFDNLKVTILQSGFKNTREREQRESYFIFKFNTLQQGLNENHGVLSSLPMSRTQEMCTPGQVV